MLFWLFAHFQLFAWRSWWSTFYYLFDTDHCYFHCLQIINNSDSHAHNCLPYPLCCWRHSCYCHTDSDSCPDSRSYFRNYHRSPSGLPFHSANFFRIAHLFHSYYLQSFGYRPSCLPLFYSSLHPSPCSYFDHCIHHFFGFCYRPDNPFLLPFRIEVFLYSRGHLDYNVYFLLCSTAHLADCSSYYYFPHGIHFFSQIPHSLDIIILISCQNPYCLFCFLEWSFFVHFIKFLYCLLLGIFIIRSVFGRPSNLYRFIFSHHPFKFIYLPLNYRIINFMPYLFSLGLYCSLYPYCSYCPCLLVSQLVLIRWDHHTTCYAIFYLPTTSHFPIFLIVSTIFFVCYRSIINLYLYLLLLSLFGCLVVHLFIHLWLRLTLTYLVNLHRLLISHRFPLHPILNHYRLLACSPCVADTKRDYYCFHYFSTNFTITLIFNAHQLYLTHSITHNLFQGQKQKWGPNFTKAFSNISPNHLSCFLALAYPNSISFMSLICQDNADNDLYIDQVQYFIIGGLQQIIKIFLKKIRLLIKTCFTKYF